MVETLTEIKFGQWNDKKGVVFQGTVFKNDRRFMTEFMSRKEKIDSFNLHGSSWYEPWVNQNEILYLPDKMATQEYREQDLDDNVLRTNFETMKGLIIDESIPIGRKDCPLWHDFGRHWMVETVGRLKFQPALKELREVMLHDFDYYLREEAIESITKLKGKNIPAILCEEVRDKEEEISLRQLAAKKLYEHSSVNSVKTLIDAYEETAYKTPKGDIKSVELTIKTGQWMPNYCLRSLGKIPSIEALEGIKIGFEHSMGIVKHWAKISLNEWIETNTQLISDGKYKGDVEERQKLLKKIILKYDCYEKRDYYDNMGLCF